MQTFSPRDKRGIEERAVYPKTATTQAFRASSPGTRVESSRVGGDVEEKPVLPDTLEVIDSTELAKRLCVPESWIRSRTNRKRTQDPIPHYRLGRYIRFSWGSIELSDWLSRQLVRTNGQVI
jgi:hypothetical protein